jgi:D-alanyl-D-alanine endopeptidase (penicillin-binding protein 7)
MQAWLHKEPVIIILMDSEGRYTRTADAVRIKKWLESAGMQRLAILGNRKDG